MRRMLALCAVLAISGCSAISGQKAPAPKPAHPQFKNLQVLPRTITHDELVATMRTYARSLGTRCDHCHVETVVDGKERSDFASDAKPEKNVARAMMRMVAAVNGDYLAQVNVHGQKVACATCHRGHTVPEQWTPPPPPERRPEGHPEAPAPPAPPAMPAPVPAPIPGL